jgi:hypothetical protein
MATIVPEMPAGLKRIAKGGQCMPFMTGDVWRLVRGVDFKIEVRGYQSLFVTAAKKAGLIGYTRTVKSEPDVVYVQAVKR